MANFSDYKFPLSTPHNNYNGDNKNQPDKLTNLQSITNRLAFKQLFSFLKLISTTIC